MSTYVFTAAAAAVGDAGSYTSGPWKLVVHTTEVDADPRNWVGNFQDPSHVLASYEHGVILQLLSFDRAGKALSNLPGGVETNRDSCIQIEVNGHADDAGNWSDAKLRWLGADVIAPIVRWVRSQGGDIDLTDVPAPGPHGGSARVDAVQRMSFARWDSFNGVCGHRHVPENEHYDPDQLDLVKVCGYAAAALGPPAGPASPAPIPTEDDDMKLSITDEDNTLYFIVGMKAYPLSGYAKHVHDAIGDSAQYPHAKMKDGSPLIVDKGSLAVAYEIQPVR